MSTYCYQNDPQAKGLGLIQTDFPQPSPTGLPVSVAGGLPQDSLYSPGTEEFSRLAAYSAVLRTVDQAQNLTQRLTAWHGGINLAIDVRAGRDFNAFYDRSGLHFFYEYDHVRGVPVYASDSPDVVSHECGHAILDALRPDFWNSPFDEVGAFHESFGDMTAILTTLTWNEVRQAAVQARLGDHNPVADLAEELGTALYHMYGPEVSPEGYLRSGINTFTYQPPESLPASAPADQLCSEIHSFSRVFTGAFYEILAGIAGSTDPQVLDQARQTAAQLLYAAIETVGSPRARLYSAVAAAMLDADQQHFNGAHRRLLTDTFNRRKISVSAAPAPPAELAQFSLAPRAALLEHGAAVRQQATELAANVTSRAHLLGFEPGRSFRVANISQTAGKTAVRIVSHRRVPLVGEELGVANGVVLDIPEHVNLEFSRETGKAIAGSVSRLGDDDTKALHSAVARLVQRRRVAFRAPGLPRPTPEELGYRHQPFYVTQDASGVKRLYRAYFDS